tara:strand:+ start:4052 stop:4954 length:903 start_codon:yes stop_codon:yes gene_type:complete
MNQKPLVSVIMNCYNGQQFLNEALDSLVEQTYKNWELVFWDNKSDDDSINIFNSYNDKRFKLYSAPNHTILYEARNKAIKKASGELIAFLDTDDYWSPNKLEKQVKLFEDNKVNLVYGNFWIVNESSYFKKRIFTSKKLPTGKVLKSLLSEYTVGLLTIMLRKKSLKNFDEMFNTKYDLLADYDFVLRFSVDNYFECIQEPVACYRIHKNNMSNLEKEKQISQLKSWFNSIKSDSVFSSQKEIGDVYERIKYMEVLNLILEKNFFKGFYEAIKFPIGIKKIKLFLALCLPKSVFLNLKKF